MLISSFQEFRRNLPMIIFKELTLVDQLIHNVFRDTLGKIGEAIIFELLLPIFQVSKTEKTLCRNYYRIHT